MKLKHIDYLDSVISISINKLIHGNVPTAVKYGSWKDGGISIPSLREKCETCRVKSLIRLITHNDCDIRALAYLAIEGEKSKRNVATESNPSLQTFLDWKEDASIVQRARVSFKNLDFSFREVNIENLIDPDDVDRDQIAQHCSLELNDTNLNKSISFDSCIKISLFLTTCRREKWKNLMQKKTFHLQYMSSFNENLLSNSYLLRQFNPICDAMFIFAVKSRTNLLGTPEVNELFNNLPHTFCPSCAN